MSDMKEELMQVLKRMGDNSGNRQTSKRLHEVMKEAAAKHEVKLLFVVSDMGDFMNQLRVVDVEGKAEFLYGRGIKKLAADYLQGATEEPPSEAFHASLVAALAPMGGHPLYVLARYGRTIQAYLSVPPDAPDRTIAIAGIKELVTEFLNDK